MEAMEVFTSFPRPRRGGFGVSTYRLRLSSLTLMAIVTENRQIRIVTAMASSFLSAAKPLII